MDSFSPAPAAFTLTPALSRQGPVKGEGVTGLTRMSPIIHDSRRLESVSGRSIFDYADALKVRVPTSCGRSGECHECIVEIKRGVSALTPPTQSEAFLRGSYRLACQAHVTDPDADVEFAVLRRQPRILTRSVKRPVKLDPGGRPQG